MGPTPRSHVFVPIQNPTILDPLPKAHGPTKPNPDPPLLEVHVTSVIAASNVWSGSHSRNDALSTSHWWTSYHIIFYLNSFLSINLYPDLYFYTSLYFSKNQN
ncbi:hypothetical protein RJT34_18811 [Clitoria ternatea]|uniref:Uncharacterized protein n=1 Tax=Clitoria ternatea TaxID=43366 RepID=A0AAN9P3Q5_CLITE